MQDARARVLYFSADLRLSIYLVRPKSDERGPPGSYGGFSFVDVVVLTFINTIFKIRLKCVATTDRNVVNI